MVFKRGFRQLLSTFIVLAMCRYSTPSASNAGQDNGSAGTAGLSTNSESGVLLQTRIATTDAAATIEDAAGRKHSTEEQMVDSGDYKQSVESRGAGDGSSQENNRVPGQSL